MNKSTTWLGIFAACIALPIFVPAEVLAQDQPSQSVNTSTGTPENVVTMGCLDQPVEDCIKQVEATIQGVNPDEVAKSLQRLDAVDVNGQRIAKVLNVSIFGNWPGSNAIGGVWVVFNSARRVTQIDVNLADDPQRADAEQEYDKTHLFDAFVLGLGSNCAGPKLAIYKFFQNVVKPKIKADPRDVHFYETSVTSQNFRHAMNIPFCKRLFSYMSSYGIDTSNITAGNPDGFSSIYSASFSDKPQH